MTFDWRANGFFAAPILTAATGSEKLFRAWAGDPLRKWGNRDLPGVCFSLDRALSRWGAERLYSVMEYSNPVRYITEFIVPKGLPLWVGQVDPGDARAVLGNVSGSQVFVERAYVHLIKEGATANLAGDLGKAVVYQGRPGTA